ncbi:PBSX family phage terminase large subunit [Flavobacterium enshiense]|uniref:PBSX family phage terminase large subunit n=1 Tax=Flavobacterium enshiense TaxID=1341165 RepID=UPI00345CA175
MSLLKPKYKPLAEHDGRYFVVTGGRSSGKSHAVTRLLIALTFEAGHRILFTRLTMTSAHDSVIAEVKKQIDELNLSEYFTVNKEKIVNRTTNSYIIFKGIKASSGDNTARLKSLSEITTLVVEEAEELVDEDVFDKIDDSIRTINKQNRVIMILNPTTKSHWIYRRFFLDRGIDDNFNGIVEDTCYIFSTYKDNLKYINPSLLKKIESFKETRPDRYQHQYLGAWLDKSEGVIFKDWEFGDFPDDVDSKFGADWGFTNDETALVEVYVDKKERTIYLKEQLYQTEVLPTEMIKIFKRIVGDRLVVADYASGGDRMIAELQTNGINIRKCRKGAGSVKEGIMLMKDYKLVVDRQSSNLAKEFNMYSWKKSGEDPIDKYNHLIDSARYIISDILKEEDGVYFIY